MSSIMNLDCSVPARFGARSLSTFLIPILMLGCALQPEVLPLSAEYPTLGKSRPTRAASSALVVSTESWIDLNLASGDDGTISRPRGYTLFDAQGIKIMDVRNYIGSLDSEPTTLGLEPGRYLIRLDKPGKHPPIFWVVVESGKVTDVDLRK
jgi:hypothetical protein